MTKACFKCETTQPIENFYRHPRMADGRLGKCKACTKRDVSENYDKNREHYRAYEVERFKRPARKIQLTETQRRMRKQSPEKYAARTAVSNAIRDGRLTRLPCQLCGATDRVQAHHEDYSKPLDIEWLCFRCHREHRHGQQVGPAPSTERAA
jgi:hypothetical protein